MGYKDEFESLMNYFQNKWQPVRETPIAWPNVAFTPPDPPSPWLRVSLQDGQSAYISAGVPGANVSRYAGVLIIQIFVPVKTGEGLCREPADDICGYFRNKTVGNVRFASVSAELSSNSLADGWLQMNVNAPFTRDEFE